MPHESCLSFVPFATHKFNRVESHLPFCDAVDCNATVSGSSPMQGKLKRVARWKVFMYGRLALVLCNPCAAKFEKLWDEVQSGGSARG